MHNCVFDKECNDVAGGKPFFCGAARDVGNNIGHLGVSDYSVSFARNAKSNCIGLISSVRKNWLNNIHFLALLQHWIRNALLFKRQLKISTRTASTLSVIAVLVQ